MRGINLRKEHLATVLCLAASLLLTAVIWYLYYEKYFTGLILNDAMDYAGIARNITRGMSFISQYITPLSLAHMGIPQPEMWRAPLWPLVLAGFQKLLGSTDEASALGTGFFFIATSPVIFLLARQWFGGLVAAGSVLLYTFTPELLRYSISGMTEPLAVFLMALTFLTVSSESLKSRSGDWLSGLILGLFYLARYNALVFLPFFLLYRWIYRKNDYRPPLRMLAGFIVVTLPWFIRNTLLFGNPLFSLQKYEVAMFTPVYPDYSLYLHTLTINVAEFLKNNPQAMLEKISHNWTTYISLFLSPQINGVSALVFIIFLMSLFIKMNKKTLGVRPLLVACFLTQLAALLVIHFIPRLFLVFTPLYIIFALGALYLLTRAAAQKIRLKSLPGLLTALFVLFLSFYNFTSSEPPERVVSDRDAYLKVMAELYKRVPEDQVILTDMGHLVSWYGDRYACKIPYSVEMVPEIKKRADLGAAFISDRILWHMPEADRSWKQLWYQNPTVLHGLKLYKRVKGKGSIYLKPEIILNIKDYTT